jgi:hypothetical protein
VAATREVEEVVENHQAQDAAAVHHLAVVAHVKADLGVAPFVNQMHVVVHLLQRVLVVNRSKVVRRFVNY